MKSDINVLSLCIIAGLFLTGCAVSNPKFFTSVLPTTDTTYGYTAQNPVTIKNADLQNSIGSSYYFLSRLRTENGNKLQLIQRYSVNNPNYNQPAVQLQNRYTGMPLNYGSGPLLDLYILKAENETDTIKIYINPYFKGDVKIPAGLRFEQ
jgi:hypothetical protein